MLVGHPRSNSPGSHRPLQHRGCKDFYKMHQIFSTDVYPWSMLQASKAMNTDAELANRYSLMTKDRFVSIVVQQFLCGATTQDSKTATGCCWIVI
eukprot:4821411-Amphidinium_carterae.1